jgi:MFS family permease
LYQLDIASLRGAGVGGARSRAFSGVARTVWLLGFVSLFTDVSSEMVVSILPMYLLLQLHISPLEFGVVDGLYQGVTAVARLGSGVVADRWQQHKAVATAGYGLSALCKLALLWVGGAWGGIAAVLCIDRVGKGVRTAPRDALISLNARDGNMAATFGVHRALDTAGVVVGPLTAYAILSIAPGNFDAIFVVSFAVAVIGVGMLVLLVQDPPRGAESRPRTVSLRATVALVKDRRFRAVTIMGALLSASVMSDAFLYVMLQRATGIAPESLPLLYIGTSCAFLVLAVPVGQVADRFGRALVFLAGHVLVIAVYLTLAVTHLGMGALVVCLILHGAYYAATDGVLAALASSLVPGEQRATGLGALSTATSLGRLAGSIILGAVWSWRGPSFAVGFSLIATAAALAWACTRLSLADGHVPSEVHS